MRPKSDLPLPRTVVLPDGAEVRLRRARPDDAEAHLENSSGIAAERVYLMTERFSRTLEAVRAQFRDADPRTALWL